MQKYVDIATDIDEDSGDFKASCKKICEVLISKHVNQMVTSISSDSFTRERCVKCKSNPDSCQYYLQLNALDVCSSAKARSFINRKKIQKEKCIDCLGKMNNFIESWVLLDEMEDSTRIKFICLGKQFLKVIDKCYFKSGEFNEFLEKSGHPCKIPVGIKQNIDKVRICIIEEEAKLYVEKVLSKVAVYVFNMSEFYKRKSKIDSATKFRKIIIKKIKRAIENVKKLGLTDDSPTIVKLEQGISQIETFSNFISVPFLILDERKNLEEYIKTFVKERDVALKEEAKIIIDEMLKNAS